MWFILVAGLTLVNLSLLYKKSPHTLVLGLCEGDRSSCSKTYLFTFLWHGIFMPSGYSLYNIFMCRLEYVLIYTLASRTNVFSVDV